MSERETSSPRTEGQERRAWETPVIEELDFSATEVSYMPGIPVDMAAYTF